MNTIKPHEEVEQIIKEMMAENLKTTSADHDTDDSTASYWARLIERIEEEEQHNGTAKHH